MTSLKPVLLYQKMKQSLAPGRKMETKPCFPVFGFCLDIELM